VTAYGPRTRGGQVNAAVCDVVVSGMDREHLTLSELARRTGIARTTLQGRLRARGGPWRVNDLDVIAKGLGSDVVAFAVELEEVLAR